MKRQTKKIWKLIRQKNFLGALALALGLWLYITLNTEFITFVKLPLIVKLPPTRAIETSLPNHVSVKVKGTGWRIFNLNYFNSAAKCEIDLSAERFRDTIHMLSRNDIIKNLQSLVEVDAMDVSPSTLNLKTGEIAEYSVIVRPDVSIEAADGYQVVGDILAKPDLINIAGNDKVVRNITEWKTVHADFENVREPIFAFLPLTDSLSNVIALSQKTVKILADVQKTSELIVEDIPIEITGTDLPKEHLVTPMRISITIRGGIEDVIGLDYRSISVTLSSADIMSDRTGIIRPKVELPTNFKLLSVNPQYLIHRIIIQ